MGRVADLGCIVCDDLGYPGTPRGSAPHWQPGHAGKRVSDRASVPRSIIGWATGANRSTLAAVNLRGYTATEKELLARVKMKLTRG